jgi:hypothetical protein
MSSPNLTNMLLMYFQYDCLSAFCRCAFVSLYLFKSILSFVKLLQKLNPQKACGPDQIPARILRDLADVIAPPLTLIFQKSLDEGNIPNDWRTANVTAIFKKGERYKAPQMTGPGTELAPSTITC